MLRIAHRNNGLTTIQGANELADYFAVGARFAVAYAQKTLMIAKEPDGEFVGSAVTDYHKEGFCSCIRFRALEEHLPSFSVMDAEFQVEDDLLTWTRPPVWALGWTQRAPNNLAREAAIHGFRSRLESAARNLISLSVVTKAVPTWARSAMLAGDWQATLTQVQEKFRV